MSACYKNLFGGKRTEFSSPSLSLAAALLKRLRLSKMGFGSIRRRSTSPILPASEDDERRSRSRSPLRHVDNEAENETRPVQLFRHRYRSPNTPEPYQPEPLASYLSISEEETRRLDAPSGKRLIVLDLNGTLVLRSPHGRGGKRAIYGRPYLPSFREFLFHEQAHLDVMVWSSAQPHSVEPMTQRCFGEDKDLLVAIWARDTLGLSSKDYRESSHPFPPALALILLCQIESRKQLRTWKSPGISYAIWVTARVRRYYWTTLHSKRDYSPTTIFASANTPQRIVRMT